MPGLVVWLLHFPGTRLLAANTNKANNINQLLQYAACQWVKAYKVGRSTRPLGSQLLGDLGKELALRSMRSMAYGAQHAES